jgi:hypothetical protein
MLLAVSYGGETCSLIVREEHGLKVFENRLLGRIFGHKREEVTKGSRRLHNEELGNLHTSPNIIRVVKSRRLRWAGHVARMEGMMNPFRVLVRKAEGKRPLGRPRRRLGDNIRMDLKEIGWEVLYWIHVV